MEQYFSNPRKIQRKKRIQTLPIQSELSTPDISLTIQSKRSTIAVEKNNLIHY